MTRTRPTPRRASTAIHFQREIEQAESDGVSRDDMTLHLTLGDVSQLRRDRTVAVSDISFSDGTMKYLGVKVLEGGVEASILRRSAEE